MKNNKNYIAGLDGIRAIAIIGVTLFHIYPMTIKGGYLGVSLFLVLTGFLLAVTSKKGFNIFKYYWKRIKRIYPSMLIVVLSTCAILFLFSKSSLSGSKQEILSIFGGYNNWWQINQNADYFTRISNASPFTHLWYMGIELQFYLIWPILYLIYKLPKNKKGSLIFFGILALVSALLMMFMYKPNVDVTRIYYGTDTRVHALLIGVILGFMYNNRKVKYSNAVNVLSCISTLLILVLIGLFYYAIDGQSAFLYRGGMFGITLLFGILLLLVSNPSLVVGEIFDNPVFKWIGKHSYSIYLWQYPVIYCFSTFRLFKIPFYTVLEIIIILILTILLDMFLERMGTMKKNPMILIPCLCIVLIMGLGGYGVATSTNEKQEGIEELQKQMEENTKKIEEQNEKIKQVEYVSIDHICFVGDSVLLGASDAVMERFPDCLINAEVSRHCGMEIVPLFEWSEQGVLSDTIVISMGTNGVVYEEYALQTLDWIGPNRNVFWVNVYCPYDEWQDSNNEYLKQLESQYPNLHIIDWYSVAEAHPEYLSPDGIHPSYEGNEVFADLIKTSIESTEKVNN